MLSVLAAVTAANILIAWMVAAVILVLLLMAVIGGVLADGNGNDIRRRAPRATPRASFAGRAPDLRPGLAELTRMRIERERYLRSVRGAEREPRTRRKRTARHIGGRIDLTA
jgi:hypothetical protein